MPEGNPDFHPPPAHGAKPTPELPRPRAQQASCANGTGAGEGSCGALSDYERLGPALRSQ